MTRAATAEQPLTCFPRHTCRVVTRSNIYDTLSLITRYYKCVDFLPVASLPNLPTLRAYSRIFPNLIQHLYIFLLDKKITTANVKSPLMITNSLSTKSRTLIQLISFLNRGVNFFERFNAEFHFRFNREKVFSVGRSLERIFQR